MTRSSLFYKIFSGYINALCLSSPGCRGCQNIIFRQELIHTKMQKVHVSWHKPMCTAKAQLWHDTQMHTKKSLVIPASDRFSQSRPSSDSPVLWCDHLSLYVLLQAPASWPDIPTVQINYNVNLKIFKVMFLLKICNRIYDEPQLRGQPL